MVYKKKKRRRKKFTATKRCQLLSVRKYPLHFYNNQSPNKVPKNVDYTVFFTSLPLSIRVFYFFVFYFLFPSCLFSFVSLFLQCNFDCVCVQRFLLANFKRNEERKKKKYTNVLHLTHQYHFNTFANKQMRKVDCKAVQSQNEMNTSQTQNCKECKCFTIAYFCFVCVLFFLQCVLSITLFHRAGERQKKTQERYLKGDKKRQNKISNNVI